MKSRFGHIKRDKDGLLYGCARKQYTRTHTPKRGWLKIKNNPRENVALIKLNRLGYTINQLSQVFGRSTSYIHRRLRTAIMRGITHFDDKRKLPHNLRLRESSRRWRNLERWINAWLPFILGTEERPP